MKRILSSYITFIFSILSIFNSCAGASMFDISGGISKTVGAKWTASMFSMNEKLSYSMDTNDFTMVEGKICNTRTGLALGVNMDLDDNYIGKANSMAGYIGFNRLFVRYLTGNINGTARWDGTLVPGQSLLTPFKGSLTHIDMVYWRKKVPMYFGLGYTYYAIPVEVKTTYTNSDKEAQVLGVSFLDPDYSGKYYSFLFGFDTFSSALIYLDSKDLSEMDKEMSGSGKSPWGIFFVAQDRFGFGSDQISPTGMARAKVLNPGKLPVGSSFFSTYLENTSSMGIRWRGKCKYGCIVVGVGYELAFNMTLDIGGAAERKGDLGLMPSSSLARYGPVARLYMKW